ncbi:ATP-grasp domain-containing protein [Epilithonimonas hominis]|uniref:ATP-grasp domain-containing protein n=1 Tax=Epilithonimonas hominis TaxID=420404 RepID=UPI00289EB51D|nr:ATP-grasp domain-containing protein [Epilithonimonas hominis]
MELNILVFPCGSEIALEIHRSLKYSRHINLFGASSTEDHGKFIYEQYIGNVPYFDEHNFIPTINKIIEEYKIDAIYPAMDSVIAKFSEMSNMINCRIIGSSNETNQICLSKEITYNLLKDEIKCPKIYDINEVEESDFPLFIKPIIGYGSRGVFKAKSKKEASEYLTNNKGLILLEYLPGEEFTVDCFTDRKGNLRFQGARIRNRISNGISVNTQIYSERNEEIEQIINVINSKVKFRGAWFAQLKLDANGNLALLEIAARFGGSSSLYRNKGVNFALLSVFDAFDNDVDIIENNYKIELDRALDNRYKLDINFDTVFCDFDDCLIIKEKINLSLLSFLFQSINEGKKLVLITKHEKDINQSLKKYRLEKVFDIITHLNSGDHKYKYITEQKAIFIDDSHRERKEVLEKLNIPVFAPDNIEALLQR